MSIDKNDRLKKIQALLNQAESTGFTPEAQAFREKAESLMVTWQIEQWELDQVKPTGSREKPTHKRVHICGENNLLKEELLDLFGSIVMHCRCRAVYYGLREKRAMLSAEVIGFASDIAYLEMLYTSLHVQMSNNLQPQPDPTFSLAENVALLKEAGMKWADIYTTLGRHLYDPVTGKKDMTLFNAYKKLCKEEGREHVGSNPTNYQRNFSAAFASTVSQRLVEIRKHTREQTHESDGSLVPALRSRDEDVTAELKVLFPRLGRSVSLRGTGKYDGSARSRGADAGRRADLGQSKMGNRKAIG